MDYIGFRVEMPVRIAKINTDKVIRLYNSSGESRILDFHINGRITAERSKDMIIARGEKETKSRPTGYMTNFAIMIPIEKDPIRIVQIVNILGNGRLVRERIKTFVDGNSTLNKIPELFELVQAFCDIELSMPGIINGGWYYAPEVIYK